MVSWYLMGGCSDHLPQVPVPRRSRHPNARLRKPPICRATHDAGAWEWEKARAWVGRVGSLAVAWA